MAKITLMIETSQGEDVGETIAQVREALFGFDTATAAVVTPPVIDIEPPVPTSDWILPPMHTELLASPLAPKPQAGEAKNTRKGKDGKVVEVKPIKGVDADELRREFAQLKSEIGRYNSNSPDWKKRWGRMNNLRAELERRGESLVIGTMMDGAGGARSNGALKGRSL